MATDAITEICQLFAANPNTYLTAEDIARRLGRDSGSTRSALEQLTGQEQQIFAGMMLRQRNGGYLLTR